MLIDSHAHLDDRRYAADLEQVIERARNAGISRIINVGTGISSSRESISLAGKYPDLILAAVGIHPHEAALADAAQFAELEKLSCAPGVVAIGETGLDYHYDNSPREVQRGVFQSHVEIAIRARLPLIVHCREAYDDCFKILQPHSGKIRGVAHCFSGEESDAERFLELGFLISFAGPLTFPKSAGLQEIARTVPSEKMLIETDSPYLAPQSRRGRRNEPAYVSEIAQKLADLRKVSVEQISEIVAHNAFSLFTLGKE